MGSRKNQTPHMPKNLRKKIDKFHIFETVNRSRILKKIEKFNFFYKVFKNSE